jgi:beta-mannosidase
VQPDTWIIETYYASSELARDGMYLEYGYRFKTDADTMDNFRVRISGRCGDSFFEDDKVAHFVSANHSILIENPKLWWPKGYGEQHLYEVKMELIHNGEVVDVKKERIGLRAVRLERSFTPGAQKFRFYVNNVPIMVKGTNWVPLDALHSRDKQRVDAAHDLVLESGCNVIRCWGGNVYEDKHFFDLCDERGIMVWQDFAMGNTNYPQTQDFACVIEEEISFHIKKTRNHPSVLIWSSDNEIDLKNMGFRLPHYDSRYNRVSHETLVRVVQSHDPYRFYLRSSPEIPEGFGMDDVPEQHMWGPRAYYKDDFYKHCTASFIGEAGYHGCPAVSSLKKFIPEDKLWPLENEIWAMHSTEDIRITKHINGRNHLMSNQVKLMFGEIPDELERFSMLSQISQAEAMKFFIERTRVLKWGRSGIIWWNMIDCWPEISDSVVDYYYAKKLAFHYIKRVQQPVCLIMTEQSGWDQSVMLCNDGNSSFNVRWSVKDAQSGEILLAGECLSDANDNKIVGILNPIVSEKKLYILLWEIDGVEYGNHYISGFPEYDADKMLEWVEIIKNLPEEFDLQR